MIVTRTVPDLRAAILERRLAGDSVGFVPTMGFLHEGQLSLVRNAAEQNGCVVVSCFVNPTVFSSAQELASYPRDEGRDLALLERERVDIVFLPDIHTVYPIDDLTRVTVEGLTRRLEGASALAHSVTAALLADSNDVLHSDDQVNDAEPGDEAAHGEVCDVALGVVGIARRRIDAREIGKAHAAAIHHLLAAQHAGLQRRAPLRFGTAPACSTSWRRPRRVRGRPRRRSNLTARPGCGWSSSTGHTATRRRPSIGLSP